MSSALSAATVNAARSKGATVSKPLKDSFQRVHSYLRLSLTERCSLRCVYCMPAEGVALQENSKLLTSSELTRIAGLFASRGVTKIRLTGGEPLVRRDAVEIAQGIGALPGVRSLGITTNGIALRRHLGGLLDAGVRHYNISLDTLRPARFEQLTRRRGLGRVLDAIDMATSDGRAHVKVNVVVMRGVNSDEVADFAGWTLHRAMDVRFIEYMPFTGNGWEEARFMSYADTARAIAARHGPLTRVCDAKNDTCKHYRLEGALGRVGFISSMSDHFCGTCNRLRVTADGALKVCLHGAEEVSLRDVLRAGGGDSELNEVIDNALYRKHWALGGSKDRHELANGENRSMIRIGG